MLITKYVIAVNREQALKEQFNSHRAFFSIYDARKYRNSFEDYRNIYEVHYKVENPVMTYCEETI